MLRHALISCFRKEGVIELGEFLKKNGYTILSSSGTANMLNSNSVSVKEISNYTGFPEILGGRVKTLHPKIYGGILQDLENPTHVKDMEHQNISPISIVAVNLYPFEDNNCIENIDIGGVTLIRAAAKNYENVLVIVDPEDYKYVIENHDKITKEDRKNFAKKAFHYISKYDIAISNFFDGEETMYRTYDKKSKLKYGCNPHQKTAGVYSINKEELPFDILYGNPGYINILDGLYSWQLVNEVKETIGMSCAASFKHNAPAGVGLSVPLTDTLKKAYDVESLYNTAESKGTTIPDLTVAFIRARNCDPLSSFGDFIALSDVVDVNTAKLIKREVSDGVIAPGYTDEAIDILKSKKGGSYIILQAKNNYKNKQDIEVKEVNGTAVVQSVNNSLVNDGYFTNIPTKSKDITQDIKRDLTLGNITLKYTPSNSVAAAIDGQVIGIGAGQQNRIDCVNIVKRKINNWFLRQHPVVLEYLKFFHPIVRRQDRVNTIMTIITKECEQPKYSLEWLNFTKQMIENYKPNYLTKEMKESFISNMRLRTDIALVSDAFFPFSDSIIACNEMGTSHILQPGGSIMDSTVIEACDNFGICMALSGIRVFTH